MFSEQIEEHPEWNKKKYRRTRDELFDKKTKKKKTRGGSSPTTTMADTQIIPPQHDLDAKWDACLDLTVRRFVYSSSAGAFAGLLFFSQYHISFIHFFFFRVC